MFSIFLKKKIFLDNQIIIENIIYGIQSYDPNMCLYVLIGFIGFMLDSKNLTDFTNLVSQNK